MESQWYQMLNIHLHCNNVITMIRIEVNPVNQLLRLTFLYSHYYQRLSWEWEKPKKYWKMMLNIEDKLISVEL